MKDEPEFPGVGIIEEIQKARINQGAVSFDHKFLNFIKQNELCCAFAIYNSNFYAYIYLQAFIFRV